MTWEKVKLGDIAEFSNGINFNKSAYINGIKFISVSDFGDRFCPLYDELSEVKKDVVKANDLLHDGDIVFVRSNGNKELVGRCMLIKDLPEPITYSGFVIRCRFSDCSKYDPVFFTYLFKSKAFRRAMSGTAVGANIQNLSQGRLNAYTARIPDYCHQRKIADVLSAYDDLIENNQKQIKLLEESAQRLYKEWFVDFHFPGHETTPIIDGLPQGWEEKEIIDLCTHMNTGGTPSRTKSDYWSNATVLWYKTAELQDCWLIGSEERISIEGLNNSSAKLFPKNTILMAIYASPTLGRLGVLSSEGACNQAALCMLTDESRISWQWLYHKLYELRDVFNAVAKGAGQQNISAEVVKRKQVIVPPKELVACFTNIVSPMYERRLFLQKQNRILEQARNRLLPKLMNGEIEV